MPMDCTFTSFTPCSQQFVRNLIGSAPSKSCELDPGTNISHQGVFGHSPPIPHKTVQCVASRGTAASIPDNCHCCIGAQEARIGSSGHEELSANLQPLLHVQDRGKSRRAAAIGIPCCERITSYAAIWIPKASFHRVGSTSDVVWHSLLSGQGTDLVASSARCECRLRHGRSLHPARPVVHLLWAHGISIRLDAVVHRRSHADSSLLWICLALRSSAFWCGAGFGARPSPLRPLYGRYSETGRIAWVRRASVCWRHTVSRLV